MGRNARTRCVQDASIYKLLKGASRRVGDPFGLGVDVRLDDCVCVRERVCARLTGHRAEKRAQEGGRTDEDARVFSLYTHVTRYSVAGSRYGRQER